LVLSSHCKESSQQSDITTDTRTRSITPIPLNHQLKGNFAIYRPLAKYLYWIGATIKNMYFTNGLLQVYSSLKPAKLNMYASSLPNCCVISKDFFLFLIKLLFHLFQYIINCKLLQGYENKCLPWEKLSQETLYEILKNDRLEIPEMCLLEGVSQSGMRMALKLDGGRQAARDLINDLLSMIRIRLISNDEFSRALGRLKIFADCEKLQILRYLCTQNNELLGNLTFNLSNIPRSRILKGELDLDFDYNLQDDEEEEGLSNCTFQVNQKISLMGVFLYSLDHQIQNWERKVKVEVELSFLFKEDQDVKNTILYSTMSCNMAHKETLLEFENPVQLKAFVTYTIAVKDLSGAPRKQVNLLSTKYKYCLDTGCSGHLLTLQDKCVGDVYKLLFRPIAV
jgi:hypothetical protein